MGGKRGSRDAAAQTYSSWNPRPNILQLNNEGLTANKISVIEQLTYKNKAFIIVLQRSIINKLTGRSGHSSRLCPISANSIASQLVKNGAHMTGDRKSTRLVNKELSDLRKIPTPEGHSITSPACQGSVLLPSGVWSQERPWHGRPQKFLQGANVEILLIILKMLTMQCKLTFTKRFALFYTTKCTTLRQHLEKCASLAAIARYITIICTGGYL